MCCYRDALETCSGQLQSMLQACWGVPAKERRSTGPCVVQACGFELVFEEGAEGASEGFAVLPEHCDLRALHAALRLLGQAGPSASGAVPPAQRASSGASSGAPASEAQPQPQPAPAPAASARQPAEARPRNTQASRRMDCLPCCLAHSCSCLQAQA